MYTANYNAGTVSVISTSSNSVTNTLTVGTQPVAIAFTRMAPPYVANYKSNSVSAIDTKSVSVVKTIAVGTNPYGIASAPNGGAIYVTTSTVSTISVINTNYKCGGPNFKLAIRRSES